MCMIVIMTIWGKRVIAGHTSWEDCLHLCSVKAVDGYEGGQGFQILVGPIALEGAR